MGQVACACLSDRNSHACRSGRFKIASTFRMIFFPSETLLFSNIFLHFRQVVELLGALSRGPQALVVGGCAPPSIPGPQAGSGCPSAAGPLPPHQTPSNIHNGRKNRQQRHRTSSPAAHLDSCASSSVCNRCGPHIRTFYFHPYSRYPPPRVAPPNPTPLAAHGSSHFIPPLSHHPAAGPPSSAHPWLPPTDRPTDPKRRQHQRRRRHLAAPTMDDYVSESDSDYTSYWRDWVLRPHPSQHLSV